MEPLLFLTHRLPYPPNKGDKVRSYHLLRHLLRRYRILLGGFVDDPLDAPHVQTLKSWCAEVRVEPLVPWRHRVHCAEALFTGEAMSLRYFRSRGLQHWVRDVVRREGIERAFVFSSAMAQYVLDLPEVKVVVDFVDLDSAKWADYARRRPWPISAIFEREARRLLAFEKLVAERAEASVFVTREEAQLLCTAAPACASRVDVIENGVDSDYFSPADGHESPFAEDEHPIVFTGTMDYWPNMDAVVWFAKEVLPLIRKRDSKARFHVVGMRPGQAVRALQGDAVSVTGRVDDVRPYLRHARVVVAPLRVVRGIQNKVLEAMAMAKPVVVTSATAAGLRARPGVELGVADQPADFANKVLELMDPAAGERMGRSARRLVLADYVWASGFRRFDELLVRALAWHPGREASDGSRPGALAAMSLP